MALDLAFVTSRLRGRRIEWHESIDTTMREAARLAAEGAESGSIVGAEQQTEGQGRFGRRWHSPQDTGLYFTVILRPGILPQQLPVLTLALGLAVNDTVQLAAGVLADLKWPNDVLVNGRKVCGILTLLHEGAVLAGVGLNVNQDEFPAELAEIATSLKRETGRQQTREALLVYLVKAIDSYVHILSTGGADPILRLFTNASSWVSGRRVVVEQAEGALAGTTAGLSGDGFLKLTTDDGRLVTIHAGGVRSA